MERLITMSEAARRLSMNRKTFWRLLPKLRANGLQLCQVTDGGRDKVRVASLDKLIQNAAARELPIVSVGPSGIGGPYQKELR